MELTFHITERKKPLFKGIIHGFATLLYILSLPIWISKIPSGLEIPLSLYLFSIILNFGSSAIYHLIKWPKNLILYPRRCDHIMIFVKIAFTYYAAIVTVLTEINPLIIQCIFFGTCLGIIIRLFFTKAPKPIIALPYILIGWSILFDPYILYSLYEKIPIGFQLALMAGFCYTTGAIFYIMKYPTPCPRYIGSHELFHLFTVAGAIMLTFFIFDHAVPYYVEKENQYEIFLN